MTKRTSLLDRIGRVISGAICLAGINAYGEEPQREKLTYEQKVALVRRSPIGDLQKFLNEFGDGCVVSRRDYVNRAAKLKYGRAKQLIERQKKLTPFEEGRLKEITEEQANKEFDAYNRDGNICIATADDKNRDNTIDEKDYE